MRINGRDGLLQNTFPGNGLLLDFYFTYGTIQVSNTIIIFRGYIVLYRHAVIFCLILMMLSVPLHSEDLSSGPGETLIEEIPEQKTNEKETDETEQIEPAESLAAEPSDQECTPEQNPSARYEIETPIIEKAPSFNIIDLLRIVPGMSVKYFNGNYMSAQMRGLNSPFQARKTAVFIDGIPVVPEWSGVCPWQELPLIIEEIKNIEVIRGSAGTLYGPHAANGAIFITTGALDTKEPLISVSAGNGGLLNFNFLYQDSFTDQFTYRLSAGYFESNWFDDEDGQDIHDFQKKRIFSFNGAYVLNDDSSLDFGFRVSSSDSGYPGYESIGTIGVPEQSDMHSLYSLLFVRYSNRFNEHDMMNVSIYNTVTDKEADDPSLSLGGPPVLLEDNFEVKENITGVSYEYFKNLDASNDLYLGADLSLMTLRSSLFSTPGKLKSVRPSSIGLVAENTYTVNNNISLITGLRYEQYSYAQGELLPRVSLLYAPDKVSTARFSVSRSVQFPTVSDYYFEWIRDTDTIITIAPDGPANILIEYHGDPYYDMDDIKAESVVSYEAGYTRRFADDIEMNLEGYFNVIHNLLGLETISGPEYDPFLDRYVQKVKVSNISSGTGSGLEGSFSYQITEFSKLLVGMAISKLNIQDSDEVFDPELMVSAGYFHAYPYEIHHGFFFSATLSYASKIDDGIGNEADAYTKLDARIGFRLNKPSNQLSFAIQNLIGKDHYEHYTDAVPMNIMYQLMLNYNF